MFKISYIYDLVDNISPQLKKIQSNLEATRGKTQATAQSMTSSLDKVKNKLDSIGKKSINFGKDMFLKTTLPISLFATKFIKDASDYSESINKVDVAFGEASKTVKEFSLLAGKNFGIDKGTALDMAALFGDMSTSMGFSQEKASTLSTSLVGLAGDLASFKNLNISEVQTALAGIFTGETESLKRLGVVMTEENLNQFLITQGIAKKMSNLTQAEKVLQRYNYVVKMTSNSHGDFIRTQAGFANQMRIATSAYKDLSIQLGIAILPHATKFLGVLIKGIQYFQQLTPHTQKFILIVAGLLAVLPPLVIIFGSLALAIKGLGSVTTAFGLFNKIILANPIAAFIASMILLYNTWDDFRIVVDWVAESIAGAFSTESTTGFIADLKIVWEWIDKILEEVKPLSNFFSNAKLIIDTGVDTINTKLDREAGIGANAFLPINKPQQLTAGGQLDVNIKGLPQGSSAGFTPRPNNFLPVGVSAGFTPRPNNSLPVGVNSVFAGF